RIIGTRVIAFLLYKLMVFQGNHEPRFCSCFDSRITQMKGSASFIVGNKLVCTYGVRCSKIRAGHDARNTFVLKQSILMPVSAECKLNIILLQPIYGLKPII